MVRGQMAGFSKTPLDWRMNERIAVFAETSAEVSRAQKLQGSDYLLRSSPLRCAHCAKIASSRRTCRRCGLKVEGLRPLQATPGRGWPGSCSPVGLQIAFGFLGVGAFWLLQPLGCKSRGRFCIGALADLGPQIPEVFWLGALADHEAANRGWVLAISFCGPWAANRGWVSWSGFGRLFYSIVF